MSLKQLSSTGTKVWLDSIEPKQVKKNRAMGATGATSNPIIIADIIKAGGFDEKISDLAEQGLSEAESAGSSTISSCATRSRFSCPCGSRTRATTVT